MEFKIEITFLLTTSIMNWLTIAKFVKAERSFCNFINELDIYEFFGTVSNTAHQLSKIYSVGCIFTLRCIYSA